MADACDVTWPTAGSGHANWRWKPTGCSSGSTKSTPWRRNPARTRRWWPTSAGCPSWTRCATRRRRRASRCPVTSTRRPTGAVSAVDCDRPGEVRACRAPTTRRCGRWATGSARRWRSPATCRPSSATSWPNCPVMQAHWRRKLARQGELRTLTRKYAADVDGVLAWADATPASGSRSSTSPRRRSRRWRSRWTS